MLKHSPMTWLVMLIAALLLLGIVPHHFSSGREGFVGRSFGWPGGWFGWDTYKSQKTHPPGQYVTNTYIADWKAFGVANVVPSIG
jgi:hypothetical protein